MRIQVTHTSVGQTFIRDEADGSGQVYQIVSDSAPKEGQVVIAEGITAFGRTYRVETVPEQPEPQSPPAERQ